MFTTLRMSQTGGPSVYNPATAVLPNGHVMVLVGPNEDWYAPIPPTNVLDLDPVSGVWTQLPAVPRAMNGQTFTDSSDLVQMSSGSILATGGETDADSDYVFDPAARTWSQVPGRNSHHSRLTVLTNGSVLLHPVDGGSATRVSRVRAGCAPPCPHHARADDRGCGRPNGTGGSITCQPA